MRDRLIVALDTVDLNRATLLADALSDHVGGFKLGLEFFLAHGHDGYSMVADYGLPILLDLKLHDIPNTVAGAMRAVAMLDPWAITIHASGGPDMIKLAAAMRDRRDGGMPHLLAVTVLTSMSGTVFAALGNKNGIAAQTAQLAMMAMEYGADGVVCSPIEACALRRTLGPDAILVTPGIRLKGTAQHDQIITASPLSAIRNGADYIVVGRPITDARPPLSPRRAVAEILANMQETE